MMLMYGFGPLAAPPKANLSGYPAEAMSTVRTARTRFSSVANRARNSAAASRIAAGRSPPGHVRFASSNSPTGFRPRVSGFSMTAITPPSLAGRVDSTAGRSGLDLLRLVRLALLGDAGQAVPVRLGRGGRVSQVPLGVERRHAPGPRRGHGLAVGVVDEITGRENAGELRLGRAVLGQHVTVLVRVDLVLDQLGKRRVTDGDERAAGSHLLGLAGLDVLQPDRSQSAVAVGDELLDHERGLEIDVLLLSSALEHDLRSTELVAAVDDRKPLGELGDEDRVLHRRVPTADHDHLLALEEGTVAHAAGGHPVAAELDLARDTEPLRLRSHGEDHGPGAVLVVVDPDTLEPSVAELDPGRVVADEPGAEVLRLLAELGHQLRAHDPPVGEARVVLDVGGVLELAPPLEALDHQRLEARPRGVERSRIAGGRAADDDQVLDLALVHQGPPPFIRSYPDILLYFVKY